jgi:Fe-S cluster assembly protein SufD
MAPVEFMVVHSFTPDSARALGTFGDERSAAADRAITATWPSATEEIWRYSRIGELGLERFELGRLDTTVTGGGDRATISVGAHRLASFPAVIDGDAPDLFADLNAAFADAVVVNVPAGTVVNEPIVITHHTPTANTATFPRLVIDAGEDSEVVVVERFTSVDDEVLVVPVVQIRTAQSARVKYLGVNELSDLAWQIGHQQAVGGGDSNTTLGTVALGGHYARVRTEARISGRGGNTRQVALYFAGGKQMHDFRTIQDHDAPHTTSDLLFKGAVQDVSASVYTGLIKIRPHARGTVAYQTNRNLTLGAGSWAESVPNLEIETNDVKCSHASTVGPIDPEHRFYLESRGVPTQVAERLIVLGFFDEVLAQLPVAALATELRSRVAAKLDLAPLGAATGDAA